MSKTTKTRGVDIVGIMEMIPHRYPFLLIDKVTELEAEQAVGIKNVTINEPFFAGHFPGHPIMPGVLIIEAMAQTAAVLVADVLGEEARGKLVYFMAINDVRFRKPVVPGDVLELHVARQRRRGNVWQFSGQAKVDGALVTQANFTAMLMDR